MSALEHYDENQLARQIYHLRKGGMSFKDMHTQLDWDEYGHGPSETELIALFRKYALKLANTVTTEEREVARFLEVERLNDLQHAYWAPALEGDVKAAEFVLKVIAQRGKFMQIDQIDGTDRTQVANVLIVGNDQKSFLEALEAGKRKPLAGPDQDDEEDSGGGHD